MTMGVGWRGADICGQDNYVVKSTVFGLTALPGTNCVVVVVVGWNRATYGICGGRCRSPRKSVDSTALDSVIKQRCELPGRECDVDTAAKYVLWNFVVDTVEYGVLLVRDTFFFKCC